MLEGGYGIMPNVILFSKDLSSTAKLMFCLISSLCAESGECWATNDYLGAKLAGDPVEERKKIQDDEDSKRTSRARTASRLVAQLEKLGFIVLSFARFPDGGVKRIIRIATEYQNKKRIDKNDATRQEWRNDKNDDTPKKAERIDKNDVYNTTTNTTIDNNSTSTITPTADDFIPSEEIHDEDETPPPPTPASPSTEIVEVWGEILEASKKDKSNPDVTKLINSMKTTLQAHALVYKALAFNHTDRRTGKVTKITDRFIVANMLRLNAFKDILELHKMDGGEFVKNIVLYSIKFKWRAWPIDDAQKLAKHWHAIYNEIMVKKQAKQTTTEY